MFLVILALHLIPAIVFTSVFFLLAKALMKAGATAYLALIISIPLCLVPLELGIMIVWSKVTGTSSLGAALGYRAPLEGIEWILIPVLLLLYFSLIFLMNRPLSVRFTRHLVSWVPQWLQPERLANGNMLRELSKVPSAQRWATILLAFVFSGLAAPIIEEVYFRGFLLPKMESLGVVAPVVNAFLFAIYHFYFPWNVPAIFIGFIPIAYTVWVCENFSISIITHIVINLLGVLQVVWLTRASTMQDIEQ